MDTIERALRKHQAAEKQGEAEAGSEARKAAVTETYEAGPGGQRVDNDSTANEIVDSVDAQQAPLAKVESKTEPKTPEEPKTNQLPLRSNHSKNLFSLDLAELARAGVIIPDDKRSKIKEEYKHIKRPLLQKASMDSQRAGNENLIMVTSAYSGEGKTFSSLNLAMSIAVERDRRVLLIDADVVKPGLGRLLGMDDRPGLVEYLNGDHTDLSTLLLPTNVHNLTVMPAGKTHHLSHELLASNAMQELAQELASRYKDRVIIFDSSPLLATSESRVLARLVGQVALVVEQDKTSQTAVQDAIACIEKEKITGLILNKSRMGGDSYYGYYYSNHKAQ